MNDALYIATRYLDLPVASALVRERQKLQSMQSWKSDARCAAQDRMGEPGEQMAAGDVLMARGHRPPFTTAPVADSQRSSDPLLFTPSARADSQRRWLRSMIRASMNDPYYDLVLAMFVLAVTAVMLVAGENCTW